MRLLNITTLRLESFEGESKPPYAILSHTWGKQEVLFEDVENYKDWQDKSGFTKIKGSCRQAGLDGYKYIWIDTCCINKSSSAELSEAINSMYKWYESSSVCYAFLEDVQDLVDLPKSRWLTRGWTLQELIAPNTVRFYNRDWNLLGDRLGLAPQISSQTKIGIEILTRGHIVNEKPQEEHVVVRPKYVRQLGRCKSCGVVDSSIESILETFCVAQKMTWASHRETTRQEDLAYCLLGLFRVNMSLLYGEGTQAFRRLQEHIIMKHPDDQSILAWCLAPSGSRDDRGVSLFAEYPHNFQLEPPNYIRRKIPTSPFETSRMEFSSGTGRLVLTALVCPLPTIGNTQRIIAILDCVMGSDLKSRPALLLQSSTIHEPIYRQVDKNRIYVVEPPDRIHMMYTIKPKYREQLYGLQLRVPPTIDVQKIRLETISILENPPTLGLSHYRTDLVPSQITLFKQIDTGDLHYTVKTSFPKWIDKNARTLQPSSTYVVAFQNKSNTFFVLWRQLPSIKCSIMSLKELYKETLHSFRPSGGCTVDNAIWALIGAYTQFGNFAFPADKVPRLLGVSGPEQRLVSVDVKEGAVFFGTKIIEVEVEISSPEDNPIQWKKALDSEPIC